MHFIYVIGAQCTGKTTLVQAISTSLAQNTPGITVGIIRETARTTLQLHQYTREDIRPGGARCLQLQKLIMKGQEEAERDIRSQDLNFVIADRSGVDPLVYAQMYCGDAAAKEMTESSTWTELKSYMGMGTIVVCEPVEQWLVDDDVRLMPLNREEWELMHETFCAILDQHLFDYTILSRSVLSLEERVNFVTSLLNSSPAAPGQYLGCDDKASVLSSSGTTQEAQRV